MLKKAVLLFVCCLRPLFSGDKEAFVVCLHGFMGAPWNMHFLARNLKTDGWDVLNWEYRSRDGLIEEHGDRLVQALIVLADARPGTSIHFVTHSMGGLVLLSALNHPLCPEEAKVGKVVLIAPPIKGSSYGRWLRQFSIARWIAKDLSGQELMTKLTFDDLGAYPESCDKLVIAGTLGFNPFINGINDGTVAVDETFLDTPHEHILVRRGHKNIVFSKKVSRCVRHFLNRESFPLTPLSDVEEDDMSRQ